MPSGATRPVQCGFLFQKGGGSRATVKGVGGGGGLTARRTDCQLQGDIPEVSRID